jgi:DNA-binding transcriptional regulator/RsmH inhibitor MraZ
VKKAGIYTILFLLFSAKLFSQDIKIVQIDGRISNILNERLPFVHILIKNKNMGTVSNYKGRFSFVTEVCDTLIFSSIGYKRSIYVVPCNTENKIININKIMLQDTIMLHEVLVLPWDTYEEFKRDFINMDYVDDDMERAYKNFAITEEQMIFNKDDMPALPEVCYRLFLNENVYNRMYYAGQNQPVSLFNVVAWAKFFEALKNGDFKKKPKYQKN